MIVLLSVMFIASCASMNKKPLTTEELEELAQEGAAINVDVDSNDKMDMAYGGTNTDTSAYTGILHYNSGSIVEVDTAAELETAAGLGAFFNEYADDADAAAMIATLSTALSSIDGLTETNGGLLYGTADNTYAWLAAGTADYVLKANGAAAPSWTNTFSNVTIGGGTANSKAEFDSSGNLASNFNDSAPVSDHSYSCDSFINGRAAGEDIDFGEVVYMDGTSAEWMLADATTGTSEWPAMGFAVACPGGGAITSEPCQDGEELTVCRAGWIRDDTWAWSDEGVTLYVDEVTSGGMTETAPSDNGDLVQVIAISLDDDHIAFPVPAWGLDDGS